VFSYTIQSGLPAAANARIKGKLTYRTTGQSFSYSYEYTLRPGMNVIDPGFVRPQWTFSSAALKELFLEYKKLPAGTYEYCVEVSPIRQGGEVIAGGADGDCIYGKVDELFLISLVEPENNAKLHENFPVLSWMVNYPFASALTYKLRVAEVKEGQNNTAAVNRNNPIYQESNLMQTTQVYPVYAKQLEKFVPYAWTVDAYYKGILLGGAESWRFTIVDDSLMAGVPREVSYLDIRKETGITQAFAIGKLKIKYVLEDLKKDSLVLTLSTEGKSVKMEKNFLAAQLGDNRYEIDFQHRVPLRHMKMYTLEMISQTGKKYIIQFKYINPDFL